MPPLSRTSGPSARAILKHAAKPRPIPSTTRTYYSYEHDRPPPYPPTETAILSAGLTHVPSLGWTQSALRSGARDAGYLDASTNLFARGEFELVMYHLKTQRLGLGQRVQFGGHDVRGTPGTTKRVRSLVLERLRGNVDAGVLARWQEALGHMSLAGNIPASLNELFQLSDEMWFLAGDDAVDTSWYTKRATLASVYAATEVFQTTDMSTEFRDTESFLDRRLDEVRTVGGAWNNVREWVGYQGMSTVNLARSWGMRI